MSQLLGYLRVKAPTSCPSGVNLVECDSVLHVIDQHSPATAHHRLESQQACFRSFEAFLPHVAACHEMSAGQILGRIDTLAGQGQLSMTLVRSDDSPLADAPNGRAYLQARVARKKADIAWQETSALTMERLAACLPGNGRLLSRRGSVLALDVLLPSHIEPELPAILEKAFRIARQAMPLARFAASGLWAPVSFVSGRGYSHE